MSSPESTPEYFERTYPGGFKEIVTRVGFRAVGWFLRNVVRFFKSFRIPFTNILVVTGFDLVQEVFSRSEDFPTPNNSKTCVLNWDPPYLLAVQKDDKCYKSMYKLTREIFADKTLLKSLPGIAARAFSDLLPDPSGSEEWGKVDIGWGYTYPGFLKIVDEYYGVDIAEVDQVKFVCAQLVVSGFFFVAAKPSPKKQTQDDAKQAFKDVWALIEARVKYYKKHPDEARGAMKIAVNHPEKPDESVLTSYFLGMIMGFIPTNGNAHARITETLFARAEAKAWAAHYVSATPDSAKDGEFLAVLHECLRINYILPGLWREAVGTNLIIGDETNSPRHVPLGTIVLNSGMAAMFDPDHMDKPTEFRPDRSYWGYLNYGHKMHFCVGWDISNVIMIEYYRALILRNIELDPAGKVVLRSMFPWRMDARYKMPTGSTPPPPGPVPGAISAAAEEANNETGGSDDARS